jgi:S-adenosylmethionine hydrolase
VKPSGIITLLTDFGLTDSYTAVMKGVILTRNPQARLIDLSHNVSHGAVFQAAMILQEAFSFFPEGTVHLAVIDPGVGGARRPLVARTDKHLFVGPDNGLFWPIIKSHKNPDIIHLTASKYFRSRISDTFHGRDIFAPVAAALSLGQSPLQMGTLIDDPVSLELPEAFETAGVLRGQVIGVDHFGNMVTNIRQDNLMTFLGSCEAVIKVGERVIEGLQKTYADARQGKLLGLIGSYGRLEIAVNLGRACDQVGSTREAALGMAIQVERR